MGGAINDIMFTRWQPAKENYLADFKEKKTDS
jgi:hypothetical protein